MSRNTAGAGSGETPLHKRACSLCARRKVKCDKTEPCSNCIAAQAHCHYDTPGPPRSRKRAANDELFRRLARYEDLMRKHNVDFTDQANEWVPSGLEAQSDEYHSKTPESAASSNTCVFAGSTVQTPKNDALNLRRCDENPVLRVRRH